MTKEELLERVAFWQVGLLDVGELRDVAYEAIESGLDCQELRLIAGDSRLHYQEARSLLETALRALGMDVPDEKRAERIVCASIARSILADAVEPIWGADLISRYTHDEHPSGVFGPLVADSCSCCNGLDGIVDPGERAKRKGECRESIRAHLREVLPEIEAWAGLPANSPVPKTLRPGFLGWRQQAPHSQPLADLERRIEEILFKVWDPIGVCHFPEARDEYDSYAPHVHRVLLARSSPEQYAEELRTLLRAWEVEGMGLEESEGSRRCREVTIQELLALRP